MAARLLESLWAALPEAGVEPCQTLRPSEVGDVRRWRLISVAHVKFVSAVVQLERVAEVRPEHIVPRVRQVNGVSIREAEVLVRQVVNGVLQRFMHSLRIRPSVIECGKAANTSTCQVKSAFRVRKASVVVRSVIATREPIAASSRVASSSMHRRWARCGGSSLRSGAMMAAPVALGLSQNGYG